MREKYPDIDNKDISKMLGKEWKSLSAEKKKIYYDKAAIVSDQHKRDHPDWKFVRAPPRSKSKDKVDGATQRKAKTRPSPANDSIAAGNRGSAQTVRHARPSNPSHQYALHSSCRD
jgi:hypothetical protein